MLQLSLGKYNRIVIVCLNYYALFGYYANANCYESLLQAMRGPTQKLNLLNSCISLKHIVSFCNVNTPWIRT